MKDISGYLIITALITTMIITTITVNRHIKKEGGKVETIFNTPLKEIIKL